MNSDLRTSQVFVAYRYAFRVRPESQIGAGVGLGLVLFRFQLDAVSGTTSGGADTTITRYNSTSSFNGPTASLGLYGRFKLRDRWYLNTDLRGVYLKIQNFKVGVVELGAAGRYFLSHSVAAELGYNLGFYKVTLERPSSGGSGFAGIDLIGEVKYSVNGFRGGVVILF
jgi:hypothetical protein